jgi:U3 small nucleolar RNA-associated protein 15
VLCAEFRDDGKLLLASDKSGAIQVFDLSSRAILRHWLPGETHGGLQVYKVKWQGLTNVISAGDDKTVKLWDITSKAPVQTFHGHQDYVRAIATVPDTNMILSGSLDGMIKLWDPRSDAEVASFKHGSATSGIVYSILPLRGGTMFLTGGGSGVKVWDMTAGNKSPVKEMWNHQKEVTALCGNVDGSRVLAGGLDGHIKIYDVATWKVVHGVKYPAAILTQSISPDEKHLAVGMSSSLLSLRSRMTGAAKSIPQLPSKRLHIPAFRDYQSILPQDEPEYTFREKRRKALREYDRAILGFRFGDALDLVIQKVHFLHKGSN